MRQRCRRHDKYEICSKTLNFNYYRRKLRQNDWMMPASNQAKFAPVILLGWIFFFRWVLKGGEAQGGYWKSSFSDTSVQERWIQAIRFRSNAPSSSCRCSVVVHDELMYWHVIMSKTNHWTPGISILSEMVVRNRLSVGGVGNRPLSFYTPLLGLRPRYEKHLSFRDVFRRVRMIREIRNFQPGNFVFRVWTWKCLPSRYEKKRRKMYV